jgi:hypothetical protein
MKKRLLKTSYDMFSFLAEKTGGWRVFVKPKLWLGIMLLGSMTVLQSCKKEKEPEVMCYLVAEDVMCYFAGPPSRIGADEKKPEFDPEPADIVD